MIQVKSAENADLLEIEMSGAIGAADYRNVLIPAIETALEQHDRIRVLMRIAPDFDGYTLKAMADDARMGLKHWSGFERMALVSDDNWVTAATRAFSVLMPCPVMVFPLDGEEDARRWLEESLGSIQQTDLGDGVLHIALLGQLEPAAYDDATEDLNAFIRRNDRFRLLLDLRDFDGWQGLGGLGEHLKLVRNHYSLLDRIAVVVEKKWQKLGARVGTSLSGKDAKVFGPDEFGEAEAWLKS